MIHPKKSIQNSKGYAAPLYAEEWVMKLDLNENIIGPSPHVVDALRNISARDIQYYPVYGELINKIAQFNNINNVDQGMVLPTNGADEAIKYIFDTFMEHGDTVLTVKPTFTMPQVYAKAAGCLYKEIPYTEKWVFPIDEFLKNIDDTVRLIIVTTPNSPTGEVISRDNLLQIIEKGRDSVVLIDETYANYTDHSYMDLLNTYDNVIITKSMSKDFAIAGLRLGYIISNPQNIEYIRRIISPFSVNVLAAKAGIAAIDDYRHFEMVKTQVAESKKILTEGLKGIVKRIYPSEANFLCVDFGERAEFIYKKLLRAGIKVKYYNDDPDLNGCFRMTIPAPDQAKHLLNVLQPRKLVIFDIDGVLIDTQKSYRLAIKGTYEHFSGQEITFEEIQHAKNLGGLNNDWDLTEFLLRQAGINTAKNEIIDKFQKLYFNENGTGYILNEELLINPDMLREIAKEFDMAVFTGRPKQEAEFALKSCGLENLFAPIITMDDLPPDRQKPDPLGIDRILDMVNPVSAVYLGDTSDDMVAAKEACVTGLGVLPPQDKSEDLRKSLIEKGASRVLSSTSELTVTTLREVFAVCHPKERSDVRIS